MKCKKCECRGFQIINKQIYCLNCGLMVAYVEKEYSNLIPNMKYVKFETKLKMAKKLLKRV
jgi:hypothetical protein